MARDPSPNTHFFIYDSHCGLCTAFRDWLMENATPGTFDAIPFGDPRIRRLMPENSEDEIRESAHVVTPAGRILSGHSAILIALSAGRWSRLIRPLLQMSFLDPLMRFTYTWISKHRYDFLCKMRDRTHKDVQ